uniref:Interleukin 1 receptor like 1 n=1 Tax=Dicentrarchus labrax TaxID=13489 RepID=A0A8P4GHP9_DICLA
MDTSRLLFFVVMVITASECSETATLQCKNSFIDSFKLLEGEAFYFVPLTLTESNIEISTNENKTVHYHGGALFFLNLSSEDSGLYTGRHKRPSGNCKNYRVKVEVFKASHAMDEALLFRTISNSDVNKKVRCPDPVSDTCKMFNGTWSWKKDSKLLQGEDKDTVWVHNASKDDEGIYTCICTWKHNNKVYKSSGSRRLASTALTVHNKPEIISPTDKELFADEGSGIKLNCSVFCGTNVEHHCHPSWHLNGIPFNNTDGYSQTTTIKPSKNTISTAVLSIEKVSAKDFQTEFKCIGKGSFEISSSTLTLKRRESIIPLVIKGVCMVIFCVLATVLVKYFAIDLALLFRSYFPHRSHYDDGKVYDAYVVYQMQSLNMDNEETLCQFVTKNLPSVLEEKCGYRLFIHGRDDIPGEDHMELVEGRMQQSRRLMVILNPGSGSGSGSGSKITDQRPTSPQNSVIGGFDWQVGLHHALIQREMNVILIQLGDTGPEGYTHLPPGLQWPEGSRGAAAWNSRFWKRVRYLMPATPAKKCTKSAII